MTPDTEVKTAKREPARRAAAPAKPKAVPITETTMENAARDTLQKLRAQERVTLMITPDGAGTHYECRINGAQFTFPKGEYVSVPKDVATLIAQTHKTVMANEEFARRQASAGSVLYPEV